MILVARFASVSVQFITVRIVIKNLKNPKALITMTIIRRHITLKTFKTVKMEQKVALNKQ